MGRKAITYELIANDGRRKSTFKKRLDGVAKKAKELNKLCNTRVILSVHMDHVRVMNLDLPHRDPSELQQQQHQERQTGGRSGAKAVAAAAAAASSADAVNMASSVTVGKVQQVEDEAIEGIESDQLAWIPELDTQQELEPLDDIRLDCWDAGELPLITG